jgi:hypothetical protein
MLYPTVSPLHRLSECAQTGGNEALFLEQIAANLGIQRNDLLYPKCRRADDGAPQNFTPLISTPE